MTRSALSTLLCLLILALGLWASEVQSQNCDRAWRLARLHRECEMIEAAIEQLEVECSSRSWGAMEASPPEPLPQDDELDEPLAPDGPHGWGGIQ